MKTLNYERVLQYLQHGTQFHASRWGDGEFLCMTGAAGSNCDKHEYFSSLSESLNDVWDRHDTLIQTHFGIQNHAVRTMPEVVSKYINRLDGCINSFDADIFVKANQRGGLWKFFEILRQKRVVLVAPERFKAFKHFRFVHVVIPDQNCWLDKDRIKHELQSKIFAGDVVIYCASMMTNVLIDELYSPKWTQIDLGSALEPYIGNANRKYHKDLLIDLYEKRKYDNR